MAQRTLLLTRADVRRVMNLEAATLAVETAFRAHGLGEAVMPPKVYLSLKDHEGDFRAMPAYLAGSAGVKWVNVHPGNPRRFGRPSVMALFVLSDPVNGAALAVMDGTLLTAMRTGAAAAVASRHLGPKNPRTLGLVGAGVQARTILGAHRTIFGKSLEARVADVSAEAANRFAVEMDAIVASVEEVAACDLVCTATPAHGPVVRREWLSPNAHVNAMGADAPGKQELDPAILRDARVYVDDPEQAIHSGEINVPIEQGLFRVEDIAGTLGEIVACRRPLERGLGLTVFDSTGLAIQDVALARAIYDAANAAGLGQSIAFDAD